MIKDRNGRTDGTAMKPETLEVMTYQCTSTMGFADMRTMNQSHLQLIVKEFRDADRWFDVTTETYLIVAYTIVIVAGILGNSLVCQVVFKHRYLRKPRNILIVNLSICDILMCTFCMPFSLIKLTLKNWHLGDFLCRAVPSLQNVDVLVSTFTIVAIAIDRYRAIVTVSREEEYRNMLKYMIAFIWIIAILCCIPMIVFHNVEVPCIMEYGIYQICTEVWPSQTYKSVYTVAITFTQYVLPLTVVITLHTRICYVLRMRIRSDPITETELKRVLRDIKRNKKNMMLLSAVAVSFALTWLPWTILNMTADFDYRFFVDKNFNLMYAICLLVAMTSSCINPIMYGWFNSNFRQAFISALLFWKREMSESMELITIKSDSREKRGYGGNDTTNS
ncbi:neuropeptide Y receptor type 5-like [Mizuhopecten yessoensis]|uniref:Neuropeptide Y receptor type 2 n=1 Tax=Mizuhopecten yessoensis TaxID=6573 RepID=A0A210QRP2_MIZYE|nr:neuropeptide Y receptor type 5-like [Mizuhopecten yessoensis]OWF51405.1 Neuropeptide Y receptor type 2 [Mizuhopecten yessoensis]